MDVSKFSLTRRNVVGNLIGRGYVALLNVAFVPLYLHLMGAESYGLIGVYMSLQALVALLDMGLSPTLTRELARLTATDGGGQEARDLVRTFEIVYWLIGLAIGLGIYLLAPWFANHVVHADKLPAATITQAIRISALIAVFQWPDSFYSGGLVGLQRQITLNYIRMGVATLQGGGAVLLLTFVSPTIQVYFGWMALVWMIQTGLLIGFLWRGLPPAFGPPRFRRELWSKNFRFTAGMTGIMLTSILMSQLDKMALITFLSLQNFGYYMLASNIANNLSLITGPIYSAVFPRFSQLIALEDEQGLRKFYHRSCQLMSMLLLPLAVMGILFSRELLTIYLHSAETARYAYVIFDLMLLGTAINGIVMLPFALQIAYGWTQLSVNKNIVAILIYIPLLFYIVPRYGAVGGAMMAVFVNIGYFALEIPIMHRRLLRGEMGRWYLRDVALPLAISVAVGLFARFALPAHVPTSLLLLWIGGIAGAAMFAILFVTPWMRAGLRRASA